MDRAPGEAPSKPTPLCFVLMPFGQKPDAAGAVINFDAVYQDLIAPAIRAADMEPLRADEEMGGGIIHKPMYERLIACEYAIADLTTANANVYYELGMRHAVRPWSTILLFAKSSGRLPFDLQPLRAVPYSLSAGGSPAEAAADASVLTRRLVEARHASTDSPVFQMVDWIREPEFDRARCDEIRNRLGYSARLKERLAQARRVGVDAVRGLEHELDSVAHADPDVVTDLLLSYRAVSAWSEMVSLVDRMAPDLADSIVVQEQLALALNRLGEGDRAERVLLEVLRKRGPSPETYGILGRVYKDRWEARVQGGDQYAARALLKKAIEAYLQGFETDWREPYPGVNAVTLMELQDPPDPRREQLMPVVTYAVDRRLARGSADYWDHATRLELAVLAQDEQRAQDAVGEALAVMREPWQAESTARNLRLIGAAWARRGGEPSWLAEIEAALGAAARA